MTDASSKIDVRKLKIGGFTNKNLTTLCINRSSIPSSRSGVIRVPVTPQ